MHRFWDGRLQWASALGLAALLSACAGASSSGAVPKVPAAQNALAGVGVGAGDEWITSGKPDLRKLTVVVEVRPPRELVAQYEALAARYPKFESFFLAAAEGGFGSGFVVVHRTPSGPRPFIVTNQHVVDLSDEAIITVDGASDELRARVVFVDPTYDLAILAPFPAAKGERDPWPFQSGFTFDSNPAKDQQTVIASGYPGIEGEPSYQVTRGYVSNERFEFNEAGKKILYVQHTAPIDLGSSGGPLTSTEGKILGVNTLKISHRDNVAFAVPAKLVVEAIAKAESIDAAPAAKRPPADQACADLLRHVSAGDEQIAVVERAISSSMVARDGFPSMVTLEDDRDDLLESFSEDPTAALLRAVVLRLIDDVGGSKDRGTPTCSALPGPKAPLEPTFAVHTAHGERAWAFRWEQGRWKLDRALFGGMRQPPVTKKKPSKAPHKKSAPAKK